MQDISTYDGTIGIDFPAQVADALTSRNLQVRDDFVALAMMNRADTNRSAGEVRMWTDILRGIPRDAEPLDAAGSERALTHGQQRKQPGAALVAFVPPSLQARIRRVITAREITACLMRSLALCWAARLSRAARSSNGSGLTHGWTPMIAELLAWEPHRKRRNAFGPCDAA